MKTIRQVIQVSVVTLFILSMSVSVEAITGNKLSEYCKTVDDGRKQDFQATAYCGGNITGVVDGMKYFEFGNRFCISPEVTRGQIMKVVIKYLKNNPQRLHEDYTELIYSAVTEAFPCNKN